MIRLRTYRLQTLLLCLLCACVEEVPPTVLRFYVYSDVALARVKASLLDEDERELPDGGISKDFDSDAEVAGPGLRFSIAVERTARSKNRDQAIVRFDGYTDASADGQSVLRQTVRVDFEDRQTRLVRIWLSRACVHASSKLCGDGLSCDPTGGCSETPTLESEPFDPAADLSSWRGEASIACGARDDAGRSDTVCPLGCGPSQDSDCPLLPPAAPCTNDDQCWSGTCECVDVDCRQLHCCTPPCSRQCGAELQTDPDNCGSCGLKCPYPSCRAGKCDQATVLPPPELEQVRGTVEVRAVYLRRIVASVRGVAAVGIRSSQVGAQFTMFVATDRQGEPGQVLARGDATVQAPPNAILATRAPSTEYVFPSTVLSGQGAAFWIGVATTEALVEVAMTESTVQDAFAEVVPAVGEAFPPLERKSALGAVPSIYAVCYP